MERRTRSIRVLFAVVCAAGTVAAATPQARAATIEDPLPPGFLWGVANSGFQSDMGRGAPNDEGSDWWAWVRESENLAEDRTSGDLPETGPGFWVRYEKDVRLARARLALNAFRTGIEWSRIFPTSTAGVDASGGFTPAVLAALDALADPLAVAHYRAVFAAMRAEGLEPMVTLNHFSLPLWLHEPVGVREAFAEVNPFSGAVPPGLTQSGWLDPAIPDEFAKLAAYAAWKFGDLVDLWCTINEPVVVLVSGMVNFPGVGGNFPPGIFSFAAVASGLDQLITAHARAYDALHALDASDADGDATPVAAGIVHNMVAFHPKDPGLADDVEGAEHADYLYNHAFLRAITSGDADTNLDGDSADPGEQRVDLAGRSDFIGVNYYLRALVTGLGGSLSPYAPLFDFLPTISYRSSFHPDAPACPSRCTDFGWEIYPAGLGEVLATAGSFGLPIYITENGLADRADARRADYTFDHLRTVQQAVEDGVADVRGYFHWTLVDNLEWVEGYAPRFGLFAFDPESGARRRRGSAGVLRAIARNNGFPARLVERYGR